MFSKSITGFVLGIAVFGTLGCGRIINGTKQTVGITSTPEGATVNIEPGGITAVTPANIQLKRGWSYTAKIAKAGYEPAIAKITRHISAWTLGNVIFPSIVMVTGFATDWKTGGGYKLLPKKLNIMLVKAAGPSTPEKPITSPLASASNPAVALVPDFVPASGAKGQ